MKKALITTLGLLLCWVWGYTQDTDLECGTVEYMKHIELQNQDSPPLMDFEQQMQRLIAERGDKGSREVIVIPLVFHIIHDGEAVGQGKNLPAELIQAQLDIVNEDFRKKPNSPGFNNDPVGVDTEIEFCLATVGPDGNFLEEPGIHRVNRADLPRSPSFYCNGNSNCRPYVENEVKPNTIWDPRQYCNAWVIDINFAGGYASFPSFSTLEGLPANFWGTDRTDGVVVRTRRLGSGARGNFESVAASSRGRVLTHELGHFFGLRHVWGDGGCGQDDFCEDTPNADNSNSGCNYGSVSCGSPDMIENYMTYASESCQNIFTADQLDRMLAVLENSPRRKELLFSSACNIFTAAPKADFTFDTITFCNGIVRFQDVSVDIPSTWSWDFGNGITADEPNPDVQYTESGIYQVKLTVSNPLGASEIVQDVVVNVRGATNVRAGEDLGICVGEVVKLNGSADDGDYQVSWEPTFFLDDPSSLTPTFTYPFTNKVRYKYYLNILSNDGCNVRDSIIIDIGKEPELFVSGDKTIQVGDSIRLNASGASLYEWSPPEGMRFDDIISPNPKVSPSSTTIYSVTGTNGLNCKDSKDVKVTVLGTTGLEDIWADYASFDNPYPNPSSESVTFSARWKKSGFLRIGVYDLMGRKIGEIYSGQIQRGDFTYDWKIPVSFNSGNYFVRWEMDGKILTQNLQIM